MIMDRDARTLGSIVSRIVVDERENFRANTFAKLIWKLTEEVVVPALCKKNVQRPEYSDFKSLASDVSRKLYFCSSRHTTMFVKFLQVDEHDMQLGFNGSTKTIFVKCIPQKSTVLSRCLLLQSRDTLQQSFIPYRVMNNPHGEAIQCSLNLISLKCLAKNPDMTTSL